MKPWEQQPGESDAAYRAARIYFEMGPTRTIIRASQAVEKPRQGPAKAPNGPSGSVKRWAKQWNWPDRARAFDHNLDAVGDKAREQERASQAATLEQRRGQAAETEWKVSQGIWLRIGQMLQCPLTETAVETKVSEDGRTTTIIHHHPNPNWRPRDVAALARAASDLQRLAAGMPTRVAAPGHQPNDVAPPVDQAQADADNRIPPDLTAAWLDLAAGKALHHQGLADAQPD